MILRKQLLRASRDNPVPRGRGGGRGSLYCGNLWWTMCPKWKVVCILLGGETKHHDSIGAGYTDLGCWRERLS